MVASFGSSPNSAASVSQPSSNGLITWLSNRTGGLVTAPRPLRAQPDGHRCRASASDRAWCLFPVRSREHTGKAEARLVKNNKRNMLSVVIPTLNAAATLPATLASVAAADEVVVADGGSSDGPGSWRPALGARVLPAPRGRGAQLAAGWPRRRVANGCCCCTPIRDWRQAGEHDARMAPDRAGYFRFALDSDDPRARRLERLVAWRCRVLALPYGDQGLLIHRDLLGAVGGIRPLPLMEDVDLVRRLGRRRLVALRRRRGHLGGEVAAGGLVPPLAAQPACLTLYFAGVPPRLIARLYG